MPEIAPNFAAVKQGLIPLTPMEKLKLEKDGLELHVSPTLVKIGTPHS